MYMYICYSLLYLYFSWIITILCVWPKDIDRWCGHVKRAIIPSWWNVEFRWVYWFYILSYHTISTKYLQKVYPLFIRFIRETKIIFRTSALSLYGSTREYKKNYSHKNVMKKINQRRASHSKNTQIFEEVLYIYYPMDLHLFRAHYTLYSLHWSYHSFDMKFYPSRISEITTTNRIVIFFRGSFHDMHWGIYVSLHVSYIHIIYI